MANHYLQFAKKIANLTPAERFWWQEQIDTNPVCEYDWDDNSLVLFSEEFCETYDVAKQVQEFLKKFRPHHVISIAWSLSCSKNRPDQFGGGALIITRMEILQHDVYDWIQDNIEKISLRALDF